MNPFIPNSNIVIDGNGKTITSSYNPTSDGDYALAITGSNVVLKNIIIKTGLDGTQINPTKGFLAMIGSITDEPVDNISLENVEIITNGYIGSINIYSANGVVLDNVKIDDSKKGLINLHSSEVTIKSVNLPSIDPTQIKAWDSIQINGHGGSPAHGKCKLIIEDSSTIDFINQEGVYTSYVGYVLGSNDAQSEHEIIIKDGTSYEITSYNDSAKAHAGWVWKKRS